MYMHEVYSNKYKTICSVLYCIKEYLLNFFIVFIENDFF